MEDHADGVVKGVILVQPHVRHLGLVPTGLFVLWSQREVWSLTQLYCLAFYIQGLLQKVVFIYKLNTLKGVLG